MNMPITNVTFLWVVFHTLNLRWLEGPSVGRDASKNRFCFKLKLVSLRLIKNAIF